MSRKIHPTALIDSGARLDSDVEIGPYSIIEAGVELGAGASIGAHCVIASGCSIGAGCVISPFCSLGQAPQDKKYAGEQTRLEIGRNNTVREFCTFNRGTMQGGGITRIGEDNLFMAYSHVAHDCEIGSHAIFANQTQLAGHVVVGDWAILGGMTGVHQFVHIGAHAITGGGSIVLQDVAPFMTAAGQPARPRTINLTGLKRRGFSEARISAIRRMHRLLFREGLRLEEAIACIEAMSEESGEAAGDARLLHSFLIASAQSKRSLAR